MKRLERLCDAVVRLESFAGSDKEQNPLYKDYHGERGGKFNIVASYYTHILTLRFDLNSFCECTRSISLVQASLSQLSG